MILHEHFAGQLVSFPKKLLADRYVHEEIYREYDGTNAVSLSKKYGFTVSWVQKIVKAKKVEITEMMSCEINFGCQDVASQDNQYPVQRK